MSLQTTLSRIFLHVSFLFIHSTPLVNSETLYLPLYIQLPTTTLFKREASKHSSLFFWLTFSDMQGDLQLSGSFFYISQFFPLKETKKHTHFPSASFIPLLSSLCCAGPQFPPSTASLQTTQWVATASYSTGTSTLAWWAMTPMPTHPHPSLAAWVPSLPSLARCRVCTSTGSMSLKWLELDILTGWRWVPA